MSSSEDDEQGEGNRITQSPSQISRGGTVRAQPELSGEHLPPAPGGAIPTWEKRRGGSRVQEERRGKDTVRGEGTRRETGWNRGEQWRIAIGARWQAQAEDSCSPLGEVSA
ncbi:hypothetical protein COCOBI_02-0230 [Coccomyxa sp. Obi]|nr:hypothetical protein COCOBI_02-0230 [Coccomyxa sp. Obi]